VPLREVEEKMNREVGPDGPDDDSDLLATVIPFRLYTQNQKNDDVSFPMSRQSLGTSVPYTSRFLSRDTTSNVHPPPRCVDRGAILVFAYLVNYLFYGVP
jgi:hypothetical protein